MSDQKYFLVNKDELEQILNKIRRLPWDDANEIMAIIKDLKRVTSKKQKKKNRLKTSSAAQVTGTKSKTLRKSPQLRVLPNGVVWILRFTNSWYVADVT